MLVRAYPLLVLGALLAAIPEPVTAHGDRQVSDSTIEIPAGGNASFAVELHWHRLVGRVDGGGRPDADLAVRIQGPQRSELLAGPGSTLVLNHLVACCRETTWAPHTVVIENLGSAAVQTRVDLALIHDNLAVVIDDGEPGAWRQTLLIFAVVSAAFLARLHRGGSKMGPASPWRQRAVAFHAGMWLLAAAFGLWGAARYGGGPAAGTMAAMADGPILRNDFLSTHLFFGVAMLALWGLSVAAWTAAALRDGDVRRTRRLGAALGVGSLLGCGAWALEYGAFWLPAAIGVLSAAVPLSGAVFWPRAGPSVD